LGDILIHPIALKCDLQILAFTCTTHHIDAMSEALTKPPARARATASEASTARRQPPKVAITLRLDADRARRLQALAEAENRSLTNYVETALLRELALRDEAERVITMYVAPGTSPSIRPEDVIRAEDETDDAYAERQALVTELWSIPDNA
jgi:uncharacterized protein (DUF4415 family)